MEYGDWVFSKIVVGILFAYILDFKGEEVAQVGGQCVCIPHCNDNIEEQCGLFGAIVSLALKLEPGELVVVDYSSCSPKFFDLSN